MIRRATQPEEPAESDFALFNALVGGGDWQKVQESVRAAAVEGTLTPKVLGAAYSVYDKCKDQGEDPNVLKTLENVILLITQTLQQLNATPAVRLIDELMTLDPVAEADAVRERMEAAFDDGRVGKDDLTASLTMMLDGMSEQDEAWEKHVAAGVANHRQGRVRATPRAREWTHGGQTKTHRSSKPCASSGLGEGRGERRDRGARGRRERRPLRSERRPNATLEKGEERNLVYSRSRVPPLHPSPSLHPSRAIVPRLARPPR